MRKAKSAISKVGQRLTSSGSQGHSRTVSDRGSSSAGPMDEDVTSANPGAVLLQDSHIETRDQIEADLLRKLHTKNITLTKCFDEMLMASTGMDDEFDEIFKAVGWENYADICEGGIALLTKEFLATLRVVTLQGHTTVHFILFNTAHEMTLRQVSNALGFSARCSIATEIAGFDGQIFWRELAGACASKKKSISYIKHPTMRFMARWINMVVLPRDDTRCVTTDVLKILYAMWRRQKYALVTAILQHWMKLARDENSITITSFVTRIASSLGVLANAQVAFLPTDTPNLVTDTHFIQAHFLRKEPNTETYVMIYKGYDFEVPLPAPQYKLYSLNTVAMPMDGPFVPPEEPRHSVAGVMTRAQRRAAQERLQKQAQDAQAEGADPAWFHTEAGPSWQSQGVDQSWQPQEQSVHTSWDHTSFGHPHQPQHGGGGTYFGHATGPAAEHYAQDPLGAIFESLTIQDHRSAGMAQQLNQVDERTQIMQQTQNEQHNRLLEIDATVQRTFEEAQQFFQYYGYYPQ